MNSKPEPNVKTIPLQLVIILSIFLFFSGCIVSILFCAKLAHDEPLPNSGFVVDRGVSAQTENIERKVEKNPDNADTWIQLGNLYFDSDRYEKAIFAYQRALSLKPNDPDVWTDLGIMYRRSGRPQKAIEALDRAIAADPKHENSRFDKGIVLFYDLDDRQGAIRCWEDLLDINPLAMAPNGQSVDQLVQQYLKEKNKNG